MSLFAKKISSRTLVIPRTWIRNKVGIPHTMKDLEEEWDKVAELMMIKFGESGHPVFRATSPLSRGTLKSKGGGKIICTFFVPMGIRLKLFFAQLFLLISSASTERSQTCVKSAVAVEQEQGDLLWQSNLIHCSRQQTC